MDAWVMWVVQSVVVLGEGAIGYFLKQLIGQFKSEILRLAKELQSGLLRVETALKEDVARIEKRVDTLEAKFERLPLDYATKEEFIRVSTGLDNKMDKILDKISELQMKRGE